MTRRRWIADEVSGSHAVLLGSHADHLAHVLRARVGQEFDIATAENVRNGRIVSITDGRVEFELGDVVPTAGDGEAAQGAVDTSIRLARQCGLGLYLIESLNEQAEICIARADYPAAGHFAATALERAKAPDCQFLWGAAEAGHLLGLALLHQGESVRAGHFLTQALAERRRLNDPKIEQTRQLLLALAGG